MIDLGSIAGAGHDELPTLRPLGGAAAGVD
jgi:hypothetical protein